MDSWAKLQELGLTEMKKYSIGSKVRLRLFGGKFSGTIIEHLPPVGLLAPKYKCQMDNGDITGWLSSHDLIKE